MTKWFMWDTLGDLNDDSLCFIDTAPEGLGVKSARMACGRSVVADYPIEALVRMSNKYLGIKMTSFMSNSKRYLIVVRELKDVIAQFCQENVEYLPFTLYNHKNRPHTKDYFIVNPLGVYDCLNINESVIKYFKEQVVSVKLFVFDPEKLSNAPSLIRVREEPDRYVIREDLAEAILSGGFSNVILHEVKQSDEKPESINLSKERV